MSLNFIYIWCCKYSSFRVHSINVHYPSVHEYASIQGNRFKEIQENKNNFEGRGTENVKEPLPLIFPCVCLFWGRVPPSSLPLGMPLVYAVYFGVLRPLPFLLHPFVLTIFCLFWCSAPNMK